MSLSFSLDHNPVLYKRAYLAYSGTDLQEPVNVRRRINGLGWSGGFQPPRSDEGASLSATIFEEINPDWLRRGENKIEFQSVHGSIQLSGARLVVETDSGWNVVSAVSESVVYDNDLKTGLTFAADSVVSELQLEFNQTVQPLLLNIYLTRPISAKARIEYLNGRNWHEVKAGWTLDLGGFESGWNEIVLPEAINAQAIKISFSPNVFGADEGLFAGIVSELRVCASPATTGPGQSRIVISYPRNGEYFGRTAYVQGFVTPATTDGGYVSITAEGKSVQSHAGDGSFSFSLSKDETRYSSQADDQPWDILLNASYALSIVDAKPSHRSLKSADIQQTLSLYNTKIESQSDEDISLTTKAVAVSKETAVAAIEEVVTPSGHSEKVTPGQAKKISYRGVTLDIPEGAVDAETEISIIPLSEEELAALDAGMINVTSPAAGYRFLPHGIKFKKAIKLSFNYSKNYLASGQSDDDVRMYFYHEKARRWQPLKKVSVDPVNVLVVSETDHFTDIINATLVVPEHPDALTYNPNTIKDIKAADPAAGINLIEPPQANNTGDARLSYPIEVPTGRKGMQPQFAVSYSSSGGSSWLGKGWDLSVPAVSVDTRWGVPRYSEENETETYMLNGDMMSPTAHRTPTQARTADKVFHARVEGGFRQIVRHGTAPFNYWWEVVEKNGLRHFYGGTPENGLDSSATLAAENGKPIFKWMLSETRDPNGNRIVYSYATVIASGTENGVQGKQVYLQSVRYAGHAGEEGPYRVVFVRDRDLPDFNRRRDVSIDARPGFKMVTADLLKEINIDFNGEPVRSYRFEYRSGAFKKTLLAAVVQLGADGQEFNRHTLDYYDEVRNSSGDYTLFDDSETLDTHNDHVLPVPAPKLPRTKLKYLPALMDGSAISSSSGASVGGKIYVGASIQRKEKIHSVGTSSGSNFGRFEGRSALLDVNGDGLADKIVKEGPLFSGSGVSYRPARMGADGQVSYGGKIEIPSLSKLSYEKSVRHETANENHPSTIMLGASINEKELTTYFKDVNGDGLVDQVRNKRVYFNRLGADGVPVFNADSSTTPAPMQTGTFDASSVIDDEEMAAIEEERRDNYPLIDPVRRWVAPYDGKVSVSGGVTLVGEAPTPDNETDGVRVVVQHNGGELWSQRILADDHETYVPVGLDRLAVKAGDRLYFRVQSVDNGSYDEVDWAPRIAYVDKDTGLTDVNGLSEYVYSAQDDFIAYGRNVDVMSPLGGTAVLSGEIRKLGKTTDDVRFVVRKNDTIIFEKLLPAAMSNATVSLHEEIELQANVTGSSDSLSYTFEVDSPIDARQIEWDAEVYYIAVDDDIPLTDEEGNYQIRYTPIAGIELYEPHRLAAPAQPWVAERDGSVLVKPRLDFDFGEELIDAEVIFTIKKRGELVVKKKISIEQSQLPAVKDLLISLPQVATGDELYFAFSTRDKQLKTYLNNYSVGFDWFDEDPWVAPVAGQVAVKLRAKPGGAPEDSFGALLVACDLSSGAIAAARSTVTVSESSQPTVSGGPQLAVTKDAHYVFKILPDAGSDAFLFDEGLTITYLSAEPATDKPRRPLAAPPSVTVFTPSAAELYLTQNDTVFSKAFHGWSLVAYNGNRDWGTSSLNEKALALDYDRFEKMANQNSDYYVKDMRVFPLIPNQTVGYWGGIDEECQIMTTGMSSSRIGMDDILMPRAAHFSGATAFPQTSKGRETSFAFNGHSRAEGESSGRLDYIDMNGDRYPDFIAENKILYTLPGGAPDRDRGWVYTGMSKIRKSYNDAEIYSPGGNLAATIAAASSSMNYSKSVATTSGGQGPQTVPFGMSGSMGTGTSDQEYNFIDMNGDGLPDRVKNDRGSLLVRLNLGYSFAPPEEWGKGSFGNTRTINASLGGGYNVRNEYSTAWGVNLAASMAVNTRNLVDVNGDGLPDLAYKEGAILHVSLNNGGGFEPFDAWKGAIFDGIGLPQNNNFSIGGGVHFTYLIEIKIYFITLYIHINPGIYGSASTSRQEVALQDINGDGYPDFLFSGNNYDLKVAASRIGRTNLLKTVNRPLGGRINIDYERSGNTYAQPQSRMVMNRVVIHDGYAGDGVDTLENHYHYADGNYDRYEREFYGYKTVTEESGDLDSGDYRKIVRTYRNDGYYAKGLQLSEMLFAANDLKFTEKSNEYRLRDVAAQSDVDDWNHATARLFPYLTRTESRFYEGQPAAGKSTAVAFVYDEYGNVVEFTDSGETGAHDDVTATITYDYRPVDGLLSLPKKISVNGGDGTLLTERLGSYDTRGNLIEHRAAIRNGAYADTELSYDTYGNILGVTGPPNHNSERYTLSYTYDELTRSFVVQSEDAFNYVSTADYDYRFGQPTRTVDINGNRIGYEYDAFGRMLKVRGPYDSDSGVPTVVFEYHPEAAPAWARTFNKADLLGGETIDTVLYIDGLKRVVQTKKEAEVLDGSAKAYGMTVSGQARYDALGRVTVQGQPVFESGYRTAAYVHQHAVHPTLTQYDVLDRTLSVTLPDQSVMTNDYGFEDGQFLVMTTDAQKKVKKTLKNVRGAITAVKEKLASGWVTTRYTYDPLSRIVSVEDDHNNLTTVSYDRLGRRTVIDNPDTGRVDYTYDDASNLIRKQTPNLRNKANAIDYHYAFNRLAKIDYPYMTDVEYSYGAPGAADNRAGRIASVSNGDIVEERFYGKLGETVKTVKSIRSETPSRNWRTYLTRYAFDSLGRMRTLVYPDGEVLTYSYDKGGLVSAVQGVKGGKDYTYVTDLAYDEFGQRVRVDYGNGVSTRYQYDTLTRRLAHLISVGSEGRVLQNIDYSYDRVGNILNTENRAFIPQNDSNRTLLQQYGYDDLHRLVSAQGGYTGGAEHVDRYFSAYQYDTIGNFKRKNRTHQYYKSGSGQITERPDSLNFTYAYQGVQPHAVTNVGGMTYSYDLNGNLIRRIDVRNSDTRELTWNEEDRLTSVADQGKATEFRYDAQGIRVVKDGKHGETVYVDPNFSIRNGESASKHIFVGNTRIATKLVMQQNRTIIKRQTYPATKVVEDTVNNNGQQLGQVKQLDPELQKQVNGQGGVERERRTSSGKGKGLTKVKTHHGTLLPGNSQKGLETALKHGSGNKAGIISRLQRLGYEVTADHRIVVDGTVPDTVFTGPTIPEERQIYYYHGDHLSSSNIISDSTGRGYQHLEYYPYGETWVEEARSRTNLPYKFTGKELDPETGLYYFGARYYDPVTSVWVSVDPVLGEYLPTANRGQDSKLPGMGGVFNLRNLGMYSYAGLNPTKYIDPDGRKLEFAPGSTPEFKKKFGEMIQYLNKGKVSAPIAKIQARTETVYLQEGATLNDFYFDPNNDTIVIHPESGLQVSPAKGKSPAKVQTPALGLLHESAHALQHLENPTQQAADVNAPTGDAYGNHEEKRVIQNIETPAAKKLGEPARQGHSGPSMTAVPVKCPTCDN